MEQIHSSGKVQQWELTGGSSVEQSKHLKIVSLAWTRISSGDFHSPIIAVTSGRGTTTVKDWPEVNPQ